MGTRHLIAVHSGGDYKIAQYGQWDGYPDGQGLSVLKFLRGEGNLARLKGNLPHVRFYEPEGRDEAFIGAYNAAAPVWSDEDDKRTPAQRAWFENYISRDLGAEILENIAAARPGGNEQILLRNSLSFAGESLHCEWAYVIDLDEGTFEVYKGFNKTPLEPDERFYGLKSPKSEYHPVRTLRIWTLNKLPSPEEFIETLTPTRQED